MDKVVQMAFDPIQKKLFSNLNVRLNCNFETAKLYVQQFAISSFDCDCSPNQTSLHHSPEATDFVKFILYSNIRFIACCSFVVIPPTIPIGLFFMLFYVFVSDAVGSEVFFHSSRTNIVHLNDINHSHC